MSDDAVFNKLLAEAEEFKSKANGGKHAWERFRRETMNRRSYRLKLSRIEKPRR